MTGTQSAATVDDSARYCSECAVWLEPDGGHLGMCRACFAEDLAGLPAGRRRLTEARAIEACRGSGLNLSPSSSRKVRVGGEWLDLDEHARLAATILPIRRAPRTDRTFTPRDADDLERYFRIQLPPAHGASSLFGAMCQRIGEVMNPKTDELPTAPEHEWVNVESTMNHGDFRAVEDGMANYLDARRSVIRTHMVLCRLAPAIIDVLEGRYAKAAPTMEHSAAVQMFGTLWEVAQLTEEAAVLRADIENRDKRSVGRREAMVRAAHITKSDKDPTSREKSRAAIQRIRVEASALVENAQTAYGNAAVGVQPCV